jgi:predicted ester cyclase
MNPLVEQNKAIALRFATEGWGTQPNWGSVWNELASPELVQHFCSWAEPICGLEANKAFNASLFEGFPDIQQTIEDAIAEGEKVMYRAALRGTHTGLFMGIPPTGKSVNVKGGVTSLRFFEGKIVEMWYELNLLEVLQQLGVAGENAPG